MLELNYKNMGVSWIVLENLGLYFLSKAETTGTGRAVLVFNDGGIRNQVLVPKPKEFNPGNKFAKHGKSGSETISLLPLKKRLAELIKPFLLSQPLERLELCYHECKLNKAVLYNK